MPDDRADRPEASAHPVDRIDLDRLLGAFGTDRPNRRPAADGRADRAQQFTPFAALRGYYDLVRERERIVEPRRTLAEDEAAVLSRRLLQVRRNTMVTVTHYDRDAYVTTTGMITGIDTTFRTLTIVDTTIPFDDIIAVGGEGIADDDAIGEDG